MGYPGYYKSDVDDLIVFPISPQWSSEGDPGFAARKLEYYIINETIRGVEYPNRLFKRRNPSYVFKIPYELLLDFEDFHDDVLQDPFFYVFDVDFPSVTLLAKKEIDFQPKKVDQGQWNGTFQGIYEYTLELREQVPEVLILA